MAAKLASVVADYHSGLALIDREFDEACQRISLSIEEIRKRHNPSANDSMRDQLQATNLRQEYSKIEREISRIDNEIVKLDQGISAVDSSIQALKQQKTSLEQHIQRRWLIERILYLFIYDKDKSKCDELRSDLDVREYEKSTLETTRRKLETKRMQMATTKKKLQLNLESIRQRIAALKLSSEQANAQASLLEKKGREAEKRRLVRKSNLQINMSSSWKRAVKEVMHEAMLVRHQQPAFTDLCGSDSCIALEMPDFLLLGEQEISYQELHCPIPHSIIFPFDHALVLPEENQAQRRLAHHLLLRLLQAIPPGRLELTLVDPLKLGQSFAPFLPLLRVEQLMPLRRVLTRADEIERLLGRLTDETEDLIQHRFTGKIPNWTVFNSENADNPLRYRVVLLFDVPEQFSDQSLWYLSRLIENGPRCGVLPIIAVDGQRIQEKRYEKLHAALKHSTQRLDEFLRVKAIDTGGLSYTYKTEQWPRQDNLDEFLSTLSKRYSAIGRFSKALSGLWESSVKGSTTVDGLDIPIGWTPSGEIIPLKLGSIHSEHHVLLAGKTGKGKSNLLHVMIHSLCEKYSPQEVDLYLLDYKQSTEFTVYANPLLPHARLVATESDPEYGITVLRHLVGELERRASLFKSAGRSDFTEYRKAYHSPLPRILLIIDEFQVLFTEGPQVAEAAEKFLAQLLKQGRSFGIHILLATQTLKGINAIALSALISQLGCRIALACGQEDSALILSASNWAAADLRSPPEAIINNSNGAKSGNNLFLIPLAERIFCIAHLKELSERAMKRGFECKAKVFNGANLPNRPALGEFNRICGLSNGFLLGESLTFTADALLIPLVTRPSFNVLFSGYNDMIHDGLLVSSLASMHSVGGFDDIVYYNGRGLEPRGGFRETSLALGVRFNAYQDIDQLPLQKIADDIGHRRMALIIDGLDSEKALHPVQTFIAPKPGEPATRAELLKRIAEEGSRKGTFIFVFIDNWRKCATPCKDLLNLFDLRVAFCMNEDDAGSLISGSIGKFKGIERPNRAVFINRMTNEIHWFRPYIHQTENETC